VALESQLAQSRHMRLGYHMERNRNAFRCSALNLLAVAKVAACHLLHVIADQDVRVQSSDDVYKGSKQLLLARKGFHLCLQSVLTQVVGWPA